MRRLRNEEGATMVEFAVSAAVLFLFLFGIFAFCTAMYSYNYVSEAAREGARYAMVRGNACVGFKDCQINPTQMQAYIQSLSYPGINPANLTGTISSSGVPGSTVTVTVTYKFKPLIPFWSQSGGLLTLTSSSEMVISQ